jgi:hypothetical protein
MIRYVRYIPFCCSIQELAPCRQDANQFQMAVLMDVGVFH